MFATAMGGLATAGVPGELVAWHSSRGARNGAVLPVRDEPFSVLDCHVVHAWAGPHMKVLNLWIRDGDGPRNGRTSDFDSEHVPLGHQGRSCHTHGNQTA